MRLTSITAEIGTSARMRKVAISGDHGADLARAVEHEHDCEEASCDIAAALAAGCPHTAAFLLGGATETPLLDAVDNAHGFNRTREAYGPDRMPCDWAEWLEYHEQHGTECPHCGAFNYSGPWDEHKYSGSCGNCCKDIPETAQTDEEDEAPETGDSDAGRDD